MRLLMSILLVLLLQIPVFGYSTIQLTSSGYAIEYSPYYDSIVTRNPSTHTIDFISTTSHTIIKSIPTDGPRFDIEGNIIIAYTQYWQSWTSDIYLIDCDSEEVELIYSTETPVEDIKYVDENRIYYIRYYSDVREVDTWPETHWYEYPYDARLGILNPSTCELIGEHPIQSYSEKIILLHDNRVLTTGCTIIPNNGLGVDQGVVNIYDPVSETVEEGWVYTGIPGGTGADIAVIDEETVLVNNYYAYPYIPVWDTIVMYDIETWEIVDTFSIDVSGYITDFIGGRYCEITSSGILYTLIRPAHRSPNYQYMPLNHGILAWVDLNTGENGAVEFNYEQQDILDMAVREGDPDIVYFLTKNNEILVFEM